MVEYHCHIFMARTTYNQTRD